MDAIVNATAEKTSDLPNVSITWERAIESEMMHPPVVGHLNRLVMQDMAGCPRSMIKKAALWRGLK